MEKFKSFTGVAAPMPAQNIDTDKVIPARKLILRSAQPSRVGAYTWWPAARSTATVGCQIQLP